MRLPRLLRSSIDAFELAVDQYIEGTPKSNKSCVESCDQANELILKAKVHDLGESIEEVKTKRGPPHSLYIYDSLDTLENKKGIRIPEHDKLIKIHKRRNPTYHQGRPVPKARAKSVLKTTFNFIERFLSDEFNLELKDIVRPRYHYEILDHNITRKRQAIGIISEGRAELNRLDEARSKIPKDYERIEVLLNWLAKKKKLRLKQQRQPSSLQKKNNDRSTRMSEIVDALIANQTLPKERRKDFDTISKLYDKVVNTEEEITWENGYNDYTLALAKLRSHLELIQHAEQ